MASIQDLTLKNLCEVLKDLRGGSIGFDPYRDPRTNNKAKLLAFILKEHDNNSIIAAISRLTGDKTEATDTEKDSVVVVFQPIGGVLQARRFFGASIPEAHAAAQDWVGQNQQHQYKDRLTAEEWERNLLNNERYQNIPMDTHRSKGDEQDRMKAMIADAAAKYGATYETKKKGTPKAFDATSFFDNEIPPKTIAQKPAVSDTSADDKLEALKKLLAPTIDDSKIHAVMDARAQDYVDNILEAVNKRLNGYDDKIDKLQMPVTVHVLKAETAKAIDLGHQHKNFATLLKMAQARTKDGMRLNIWLKGPAGSGKTTAAKKVSEALQMQFQFNGAISTEYELMGFKDASGNYHRTAFREIFENGGVYLFDEVDSSLPKAVLAFNAALANGECRFPDQMVNRHPDCVVLAGANTAGNGANSDYVGRMKQDLAFLNRFVMLDWPLDEALEKALASNKDWVRKVQRFRSNAVKRSIKGHIISPRATFYGEALLAAGLDERAVEQAVLRGALTDDQWGQLCQ